MIKSRRHTGLTATIRYLRTADIRKKYGAITILYGARSPGDLLYKKELGEWQLAGVTKTVITVDKADDSWKGCEGLVPTILYEMALNTDNATCIVCVPRSS